MYDNYKITIQYCLQITISIIDTLMGIARRDAAGDDALLPERPPPALTPRVSPRIVPTSQGGVQFPTGGIPFFDGEPASASGGPEGQQIR